jgi:hypothetical protein
MFSNTPSFSMWSFAASALLLLCALSHQSSAAQSESKRQTCRNVPGSAGFPDAAAWSAFNASVSGRLVTVVPSAKFCSTRPGGCTDAEWSSALFRSAIPGAMNQVRNITEKTFNCINGNV